MSYKPIDHNLKTAFVAGLMLTEHDVTLTPFVAELSYPGLSIFFTKCVRLVREMTLKVWR